MALIYDMSVLNEYVHQASFKLEGWEEMFVTLSQLSVVLSLT